MANGVVQESSASLCLCVSSDSLCSFQIGFPRYVVIWSVKHNSTSKSCYKTKSGVVLDTVLFYTELVPMSLGMPYAHVANALHFDYSDYTTLFL
jgi:hypothetical protein